MLRHDTRRAAWLLPAVFLAACGSDDPVAPQAACRADPVVLTLAAASAARVEPSEVGACFRVGGNGARYLLVPQFATASSDPDAVGFTLGANAPAVGPVVTSRGAVFSVGEAEGIQPFAAGGPNRIQAEFDRVLRVRERALAPGTELVRRRAAASPSVRAVTAPAPERDFKVLEKLEGTAVKTARARLRFTGQNVAVYVDVAAPEPGFTDDDLAGFATLFDQTLYPIDVNAFGTPSDIDENGRVIVLITPLVNALTAASRCAADGFVTGYFYGVDLNTRQNNSNKGELFYALAPDPAGTVSCPHSKAQVTSLIPPTFIHEFQHMISYNAHRLQRDGRDEETWLNEGLSHIAEELGSLHYERQFPPPLGRTDPVQLFPDASQSYLVPNLINAYNFLASSRTNSVTTFKDFGTLPERGAAWLFLRWLGDQKGEGVYRSLVQTQLVGTSNVSAAAGEPFEQLFADFGVAVWTDSLVSLPRTSVSSRYRFASRNLRRTYARLFATNAVPTAFPITLSALGGAGTPRTMKPGTVDYYELRVPAESASVQLRFAPGTTDAGFATALNAQVAAFRLPQ